MDGFEGKIKSNIQEILARGGPVLWLIAALSVVMLALILQSSAAVALLTAGFASARYLAFPAGLAVVLGGDLGSALIIQVLSFRLDWLIPLLLSRGPTG